MQEEVPHTLGLYCLQGSGPLPWLQQWENSIVQMAGDFHWRFFFFPLIGCRSFMSALFIVTAHLFSAVLKLDCDVSCHDALSDADVEEPFHSFFTTVLILRQDCDRSCVIWTQRWCKLSSLFTGALSIIRGWWFLFCLVLKSIISSFVLLTCKPEVVAMAPVLQASTLLQVGHLIVIDDDN